MPPSELPQDMAARRIDRPVPLRERVYQAMQELIISRQLAPGQHLVESELAEMLGVSRQPIREALQLLNSEGWVDLRPGYGAFVHAPTDTEVDQLLAVRSILESESARLAAENADTAGIERLKQICVEGQEALERDDIDAMVAANAELHRTVTEMSGNQVLLDFVTQVDRRVRWYYTPIARKRGHKSWEEHGKLIDAIAFGNGDEAAEIMREHTERTRQSYLAERANKPAEEQPVQIRSRRRRTVPRG
ncbi:DNA-binding GntR family transcriptional regulator [Amycolatopsis bartoniae]|uniref:Transcriptional regulator n=1 Tax=Amycolatopsis bartoniae TaxID=941986 RepID=A0A8H9MDS9_9PSEU|nr:GntR family transcriptional regulator [Amycolatopsis bartoniae]MBB2937496.1 DNA-binding GntR family transcriptional regulator [Amycolatopsis bartoniae]TVS99042.1 GntR family transcriptional regulator [Amycolatopsis bartoniae]GHF81751.1 transcriptional regulator [Amycolatopsis bartoniae]